MRSNIIINEITKICNIDKSQFDANTPITQYNNLDSLFIISMIALIDEHFGVLLKWYELEKCTTVNDILKLIDAKK